MTEPTNFRTYPWRLECPTIQWCQGKTHSPGILLKITNDLKNLRAIATRKRSQTDTKTTIVVIEATISPNQSERSKVSLDQSESRI